ncbi:MAG: class I SAM-dependent methyltransferase, partial [Rudaea sp.]
MKEQKAYSKEPLDQAEYTAKNDRFYSRIAGLYEIGARILPFWQHWLSSSLAYIQGPRVLEISFGTGYLFGRLASRYEAYGIDYNERFVKMVADRLVRKTLPANICRGKVEALPYPSECFDSIVNTMAFTGYPDSTKAMSEMHRVLKRGGRLIIVDVNYPKDLNRFGRALTRFYMAIGDIVRDMSRLFGEFDFEATDQEIGA